MKEYDPPSLVDITVEPSTATDIGKLTIALEAIVALDPRASFKVDEVAGQVILSGADEMHLDALADRVRNEYGVAARFGTPQVAYRETIGHRVEHDYTHKRRSAETAEFARMRLIVEPSRSYSGNPPVVTVEAEALPPSAAVAAAKGIHSGLAAGPAIGYPLVDMTVKVFDGAWNAQDSTDAAFETAARAGLREALERAHPVVLEPVVAMVVLCLPDIAGTIGDDLIKRRGEFVALQTRNSETAVSAEVPIANLFGYANFLRTSTAGRGTFEIVFCRYQPVPDSDGTDPRFSGAMVMRA